MNPSRSLWLLLMTLGHVFSEVRSNYTDVETNSVPSHELPVEILPLLTTEESEEEEIKSSSNSLSVLPNIYRTPEDIEHSHALSSEEDGHGFTTEDSTENLATSGCSDPQGCSPSEDFNVESKFESVSTVSSQLLEPDQLDATLDVSKSTMTTSPPTALLPNITESSTPLPTLENLISVETQARKESTGTFRSSSDFKETQSVQKPAFGSRDKDIVTDINNVIVSPVSAGDVYTPVTPRSSKATTTTQGQNDVLETNFGDITKYIPTDARTFETSPPTSSQGTTSKLRDSTSSESNVPDTTPSSNDVPSLYSTLKLANNSKTPMGLPKSTLGNIIFSSPTSFSSVNTSNATPSSLQPRLTNPTCILLPVCIKVHVSSKPAMCDPLHDERNAVAFRRRVSVMLDKYLKSSDHKEQIVLELNPCTVHDVATSSAFVTFFVTDSSGEYEEYLTDIAGRLLRKSLRYQTTGNPTVRVIEVEVVEHGEPSVPREHAAAPPTLDAPHAGMVIAIAISAVAGACLCLLCVLLIVMKQRLTAQQTIRSRPPLDNYSLDSFSINASFRRRRQAGLVSSSSFLNHAFASDEDDAALPSNRMSSAELSNIVYHRRNQLVQEFENLPMNMPKLDEVPPGAEVKNRYANVVPNPKTRVLLSDSSEDAVASYINANYVKGHGGRTRFYIACQSPLAEYTSDFWKMVWEQQSRVILMLTLLEENSICRCASYFPESTLDFRQVHGDYQVSLIKKDIREIYTASTLRLYDGEQKQSREVMHLWYTAWPAVGVPKEPSSLITYLLQARPFINCNSGPTVVHCSAGTGRTGVVMALDVCMRQYEESRQVDVLRSVARIRQDRGGAVQNKDQYLLIHEAMQEYVTLTANQSNRPSIRSNH